MSTLLRIILTGIVAIVVMWLGCELWQWVATETKGDFPERLLCILTVIAVICWWVWFNFGNALQRR